MINFPKTYLGLIFWFFFQNSNWFLHCQHFFTIMCYFFVCLLLEKLIYPLQYYSCFSPEGLEELLLTFLITYFQQRRVLQTCFIIYEEFHWFMKCLILPIVLKKITSSKDSCDLDYYFGIFWKVLCSTTLMQIFIARV